ncbi:MAG: DCC1-like thiol-disulfide oxidoreductase family protein [Cyanobacteria bacterium P01_D01_bin.105]
MVSSEANTATTSDSAADTTASIASSQWQLNLLYDGDCPLCLREVNFLQKKDAGRGLIKFTDIADINYDSSVNGGVDFETAMGRIHAVRADGTLVKNVAVFQEVYDALGIGWLYAPTKWPVISAVVSQLYDWWADKRLAVTGRASLADVIAEREQKIAACEDAGRCRLDADS